MNNRTVLIGLDGATFSILDPLMEEGVMPFLKKFIASGVRAKLRSVIPPLTPPAWTTVMTGRSPGNHGILDFFRFEFNQDDRHIRVVDSRDVSCETIWSMASRQGLKATVLNFPLTSPPRPISGYMLPGWVPWRHLRLASYPSGLYDDISVLPGFNARELAMDMGLEGNAIEGCQKKEDYEEWIHLHIRRERQWFEIARHLMTKDPCELTAVLFDGVDKLQHFVWRFLDPAYYPASPTAWEQKIRSLCCDYFREIDRIIEQIVTLAGPDANTVIVSDHGFCASEQIFHLNAWLEQHGYLTWADTATAEPPGKLGLDSMARRFYEVDWDKTTAYCPTPSGNGIFITLDKSKCTDQEYMSFRQRLTEELEQFSDPVSGEPVIERIWTREEAFTGDNMKLAPDLTLSLRDNGFVSILPSENALISRPEPTGTHHPDGVFIAAGPGIDHVASMPDISIVDVAPVVLYTLGLAIPEDLEGRAPTEIFHAGQLDSCPIRREGLTRPPEMLDSQQDDIEDKDGEAEMMQRLRALGYVE